MKPTTNVLTGVEDKTASAVKTAIRESYNLNAVPRLRADWNLNRYVTPTADNIPAMSSIPADTLPWFDPNIFPISSIIEPLRPTKGITKAIIGQAVAAATYTGQYDPRFYIADDADLYKYWVTPYITDAAGVFPLHTDGSTICRPHVLYPSVMKANKIVIKVDNTWASPKSFKIRTRATVGTSADPGWSVVGAGATIATDGSITLYYNGSSWVSARPATLVTTNIAGIMFWVDSMGPGVRRDGNAMTYQKRGLVNGAPIGTMAQYTTDGSNSNLSLISIEAHYEADLTDRLISVSDTFDIGDVDELYPIGALTTNQADITLSNDDNTFNNENTTSPYYKILEPNVEFNLEYIYTVGSAQYSVQQFKMYCGEWGGQYEDEISLTLEDYSTYLKELKPRATMYEGKTTAEIVWRLMDSVGFVDYEIDLTDSVGGAIIPVFWTDGTQTVWELLDSLAKATQTAIYFDSRGKLKVKTREAAFKKDAPIAWTLYGQQVGNNLTDIMEMSSEGESEANNIDVKYKAAKWRLGTTGEPALSKVWEPEEETVALRSAPLYANITSTSTKIWLFAGAVLTWPYASTVNIDGEILSYEGKEFVYYTYTKNVNGAGVVSYTSPVKNTVVVKSDDEKTQYNALTPSDYQSKNYLNGALIIKERNMWGTSKVDHLVDTAGWATQAEYNGSGAGTLRQPAPTFYQSKQMSVVTLTSPNYLKDANDTYWVYQGSTAGTPHRMYGTRMRFRADSAHSTQRGGLAFNINSTRNNGYYVEIAPTLTIGTTESKTRSEVMIYSKKNGKWLTIAMGARVALVKNRWYDIDVYYTPGTQDSISVWINGTRVAQGATNATTKQIQTGKYCMYVRGKSVADYEYFYGVTRPQTEPADNFGFYDLEYGGMRSGYWQREIVYQIKTRTKKIGRTTVQQKYRLNDYVFDEFGPYVHEVRQFDVKFDPAPVQNSTIFSTNTWYAAVLEYLSTPFGARFSIANVSRKTAILNGEDTLIYNSAENTVNQVLTVLGRDLDISDEEVINVKNTSAIRSRGQIDSELSSDWLQTKDMAQAVATWMSKHWSMGLDNLSVTIFGNPLIEIGDVVTVDYDVKAMDPSTHKYFVVGVSSSFETGIETTLTLRRVNYAPDEFLAVNA